MSDELETQKTVESQTVASEMEKLERKSERKPSFMDRLSICMAFLVKISTAICAVLIVVLFFLLLYHKQEIQEWAKLAVENYGYGALFVLTWLSDVLIQPIPADFLVFGSRFGGSSLLLTAVTAGTSSALGGTTGYYVGRLFGPWRFRRIFGSKILRAGRNLFRKHGALAIFVAGVSPIPYSATCWIGGIYKTPLHEVVIASLISRTLRYIVVGWLTGFVK